MYCEDMQIAHETRIVSSGKCIWRLHTPLCAQVIVSFVSGECKERPLITLPHRMCCTARTELLHSIFARVLRATLVEHDGQHQKPNIIWKLKFLASLKRNRNETSNERMVCTAEHSYVLCTYKFVRQWKTSGEISLYKHKIYCRFFFRFFCLEEFIERPTQGIRSWCLALRLCARAVIWLCTLPNLLLAKDHLFSSGISGSIGFQY